MSTSKNTCTENPNDRGGSSKRPRTLADTGSYDPVISTPSECRAKRIKILKQKLLLQQVLVAHFLCRTYNYINHYLSYLRLAYH